jgi:hypothetical protein
MRWAEVSKPRNVGLDRGMRGIPGPCWREFMDKLMDTPVHSGQSVASVAAG